VRYGPIPNDVDIESCLDKVLTYRISNFLVRGPWRLEYLEYKVLGSRPRSTGSLIYVESLSQI
jgi:hypothetical protein